MDLSVLANEFKVTDLLAQHRALVNTENGRRTAMKEIIGEKAIKRYNVWERLFPGYTSVKRCTSVKLQRSGVDFIIDEDTFIDIKVDIGPNYENIIPVEIRQNKYFTMLSSKKTDYILHIILDDYKRRVVLIDYQWLAKLAHKVAVCQANHLEIPFQIFTSNNGTGEYIKLDYTTLPPEAKAVIFDL